MVAETPVELLREIYVSERFSPEREAATAAKLREWERLGRGEVVAVSESVFVHMSDTATPQGILAVAAKPQYSLEEILRRSPAHLLLLEGIQDPGNLGTMVRTGEGAGVTGILMSPGTVDLFSPKVVRSTMGSISLGTVLVTGSMRVPRPAAGITAFLTFMSFKPHLCSLKSGRALRGGYTLSAGSIWRKKWIFGSPISSTPPNT